MVCPVHSDSGCARNNDRTKNKFVFLPDLKSCWGMLVVDSLFVCRETKSQLIKCFYWLYCLDCPSYAVYFLDYSFHLLFCSYFARHYSSFADCGVPHRVKKFNLLLYPTACVWILLLGTLKRICFTDFYPYEMMKWVYYVHVWISLQILLLPAQL